MLLSLMLMNIALFKIIITFFKFFLTSDICIQIADKHHQLLAKDNEFKESQFPMAHRVNNWQQFVEEFAHHPIEKLLISLLKMSYKFKTYF